MIFGLQLIQIIIVLIALFAVSRAYMRFTKKDIKVSEFAFWALIWGLVIVATFIPGFTNQIAAVFGIGRGVDLFIYLGLMLLFYIEFRNQVRIEKIEQQMARIVSEVTIKRGDRRKK